MERTPLLRAPPFPGVRPAVAAITRIDDGAPVLSEAEAAALAARLRDARVGGSFWAPPIAHDGGPLIVLRPRDAADAEAMAIAAHRLTPGRIIGCGPAAHLLPEAVERHEGERDPWSVLRPGTILFADAADEWATIATVAGVERVGPGMVDLAEALGGMTYQNPFNGGAANADDMIALLAFWRGLIDANRPIAVAAGMAWWKRRVIERFLWAGHAHPLRFDDMPDRAVATARKADGSIALWPAKAPGFAHPAAAAGVPLVRIEDGFVRSVGLGVDLHPPLSIVIDANGIYYDPRGASALETILATARFAPELLERAAALRKTIVAGGISKYASGAPVAAVRRARRTILVAGQVEDDASVRVGGGAVAGNLDLLVRARAAEPDARILFKPHPDVDAGHRRGRVPDATLLAHADEVVRGESMATLLDAVDAVHVLTSLTGFEALLRGREVIVHGQPFYAGWGLTRDLGAPLPRRGRVLTLDQLVAGTLILYPRYLDPVTGLPCPPEVLLARLAGGWRPRWSPIVALRGLQGRIARALGRWTSGPKPGVP